MSKFYVAILEANNVGEIFAYVPDLPGVTASAATRGDTLALAVGFANDYVRDLVNDGHPVPRARDIDAIPVEADAPELARALIPVEVPGESVKISISIDKALLARSDRAATARGVTRSAFIADALGEKMRVAGKQVAVVGSGGSAAGAVDDVAKMPLRDFIIQMTARPTMTTTILEPKRSDDPSNLRAKSTGKSPKNQRIHRTISGKVEVVRHKASKSGEFQQVHGRRGGAAPEAVMRNKSR